MAVGQKRMTYGEFEQFIAAPENHDRRFELINGEIVEVSPTEEHATLAARISGEIYADLKQHPIGRVGVEPRHKMPEDNHHALLPDVAFTSHERALPIVKRAAVPQLPDLAVEIKLPDDSYMGKRDKAAYYLANGARMVWLVYPEKQFIEVYPPAVDLHVLMSEDTINGGDVLPGFTLPVRDVFDV